SSQLRTSVRKASSEAVAMARGVPALSGWVEPRALVAGRSRKAYLTPVPDTPRLVTTPAELKALAGEVRTAGRLALDPEFVWERTYRPMLGVVQIATEATAAIVDAIALRDLSPLFPVLRDPKIPVVLHGGGQDLEIMALLMGEPMRGVVD